MKRKYKYIGETTSVITKDTIIEGEMKKWIIKVKQLDGTSDVHTHKFMYIQGVPFPESRFIKIK